jgi:putative phosphoribosyl transferase
MVSALDVPRGRAFSDRRAAGRALAERLRSLAGEHPVVLALPRGGVPVAFEVAAALDAPLDVLVARKIGAPGNPELGIGAVAEGGVRVLSDEALRSLLVSPEELEYGTARAGAEVTERVRRYRGERSALDLRGRTAIVVDDGLATGGTARAALRAVAEYGARRAILAVPVGALATAQALRAEGSEAICLVEPEPLWAIGLWYEDFSQVSDREVEQLLARSPGAPPSPADDPAPWPADDPAPSRADDSAPWPADDPAPSPADDAAPRPTSDPPVSSPSEPPVSRSNDLPPSPPSDQPATVWQTREALIPCASGPRLAGDLLLPERPSGLVLFAHGSGSSRRSPRNREVASALLAEGLATLLFDLLTPREELRRANVFDVPLLAGRLIEATRWARAQPELAPLPIGYFGASTGAGAALWAAAELDGEIGAVVSRGGRPDLALARLGEVTAPVLLIVGGGDTVVLDLNREALAALRCPAELEVLPGATHLFEEPGALEEVARLAALWFGRQLVAR